MDHLGEVPDAGRPDVAPARVGGGRQRLEDRAEPLDRFGVAADHHRVALGDAPDAAARADVDEVVPDSAGSAVAPAMVSL